MGNGREGREKERRGRVGGGKRQGCGRIKGKEGRGMGRERDEEQRGGKEMEKTRGEKGMRRVRKG